MGQISPRFVSLGLLLVSGTHAPWHCLQGIARGEMIGEGAGWGGRMERVGFEIRKLGVRRRSQLLDTEGRLRAEFIHDAQASEVPQHREAGVG